MLFQRDLTHILRDKSALLPRLLQTGILAVLTGIIFFKVGEESATDAANLQSRFGAITICCAIALMFTGQAALLVFPEERPIFLREYITNHYSIVAYFLSHLVIEAATCAVQMLILVSACGLTRSCVNDERRCTCLRLTIDFCTKPGYHHLLHGRLPG